MNTTNVHEYSVSELSGKVKNIIEDNLSLVRVRGELGRVVRAASGHMYMDLKDERAVINGVMWKGNAARLKIEPEQGMEVVATGKMTTYPGQSRYQLIMDSLEPAGVGALMALFEKRKKQLAAEGLFDEERKKQIPYLPKTIGVVTSPSGAVIRDILHRLRERFPAHVIVWPTLVQGKEAEKQIVTAIKGFNALAESGEIPRPDVLIVARGGGSLEDLWCFNEESVARAAAASGIPLISAVGHETDTTLIDYVSDRRAPTPTAAAEFATPVRAELISELLNKERRLIDVQARMMESARSNLRAASRGLGQPQDVIGEHEQRYDRAVAQLSGALRARLDHGNTVFARVAGRFSPTLMAAGFERSSGRLSQMEERIKTGMNRGLERRCDKLNSVTLGAASIQRTLGLNLEKTHDLQMRLDVSLKRTLTGFDTRLEGVGKLLSSLSHHNVLARGFALVRDENDTLIRTAKACEKGGNGSLEFVDGRRVVTFEIGNDEKKNQVLRPKPEAASKSLPRKGKKTDQANLFDD